MRSLSSFQAASPRLPDFRSSVWPSVVSLTEPVLTAPHGFGPQEDEGAKAPGGGDVSQPRLRLFEAASPRLPPPGGVGLLSWLVPRVDKALQSNRRSGRRS